jgi:hypothetical protein
VTSINPDASAEGVEALARLTQVLDQADQRESFRDDPAGTLQRAGVDMDRLPRELIEFLSSLSVDELALLSRHSKVLVDHGFFVDVPGVGRLCFV